MLRESLADVRSEVPARTPHRADVSYPQVQIWHRHKFLMLCAPASSSAGFSGHTSEQLQRLPSSGQPQNSKLKGNDVASGGVLDARGSEVTGPQAPPPGSCDFRSELLLGVLGVWVRCGVEPVSWGTC